MKLTIQEQINRFKAKHGDGEIKMTPEGRLDAPRWLVKMVYHLSGIRSKKRRVVKKTVTRKINELLEKLHNES